MKSFTDWYDPNDPICRVVRKETDFSISLSHALHRQKKSAFWLAKKANMSVDKVIGFECDATDVTLADVAIIEMVLGEELMTPKESLDTMRPSKEPWGDTSDGKDVMVCSQALMYEDDETNLYGVYIIHGAYSTWLLPDVFEGIWKTKYVDYWIYMKNDKYGIVNSLTGKNIIPCEYDEIRDGETDVVEFILVSGGTEETVIV